MYFSKEESTKLVKLGKTNKTALRAYILLMGYGKPVIFSNSSLAAKLDVSQASVSVAVKELRANSVKLYKVGTAYIYIPEKTKEEWQVTETGDTVMELDSVAFISQSEQDDETNAGVEDILTQFPEIGDC